MTLEELLNKLIEKGWKPRGFEKVYNFGIENGYTVLDTKKANYISFATSCVFREDYGEEQEMDYVSYTYRELVSKESGLWQFVCKNGMVDRHKYDSKTYEVRIENWIKRREVGPEGEVSTNESWRGRGSAEYRLIESSLKDESELEQFLLDNIKIDVENRG